MKARLRLVVCKILQIIPLSFLYKALSRFINLRLEGSDSKDALRFLLELDNFLYNQSGQWAVKYDNGRHAKHRLTQYVDHFAQLAAKEQGPYLDIGCGKGELARAVACVVTSDVTGIDIVPNKIEQAQKGDMPDNLTFIVGDALTFDLNKKYKTIILSNVLEHIEKRVEFLKAIVEYHNPECFIIRVPNFERDWRVPLKKELGIEWRLDVTHCTEHSLDEFRHEMKEAGLKLSFCEICWGEIWAIARPEQSG